VHSDHKPVELFYSFEPNLKIIWAHAGMSSPPDIVERMMAKYDTLYADTSYRENDIIVSRNKLDPAWRRVLERFPDRFMVGTDTWVNDQWAAYADLVELNRMWLSLLSREIAEKIAYKNAERLFGRKVGKHLIGQR
jgi:predicted TIM-barrel fold metal-dependent hydrolase